MCECWQLSASVHSGSATSLSPLATSSSSAFFSSSSARPRSRPPARQRRRPREMAAALRRPLCPRASGYCRPRAPPPPRPRRAGSRRPAGVAAGAAARCEAWGKALFALRPRPPALSPRGAGGEEGPWDSPGGPARPGPPGQPRGSGPGHRGGRERLQGSSPAVTGSTLQESAVRAFADLARHRLLLNCPQKPIRGSRVPKEKRVGAAFRRAAVVRVRRTLSPVPGRAHSSGRVVPAAERVRAHGRSGRGAQMPPQPERLSGVARDSCPPEPRRPLTGLNHRATTTALDDL